MSGDLNGDGRVDLVTTMPQADAVAVFLANPAGGFAPAVVYPAGDGVLEGVLVDLNNDGRLDLALEGSSDAFVLFGDGAGGFGPPGSYTFAPAIVSDVRAGDFNGDGRLDLAIATREPNDVHILLQAVNGTFSTATTTAVSAPPVRLVVRDMNGDDRLDVIASHQVGSPTVFGSDFVSILAGSGAGGLGSPLVLPLGQSSWISEIADLGDLNGDGHADLGVVEFSTNRVVLLFGNGASGFVPQLVSNAAAGLIRVVSGDVNGDGSRDLVYSTTRGAAVQLGDGDGNFAAPVLHAAAASGAVRVVDVNGDGRLDIVVGSGNGEPAGVVVLLNLCGQPSTDLTLSVTDSPDPVAEGNTLTYSATITNQGPAAAPNVTFTQLLPAGYTGTASPSTGTCSVTGRLISCGIGLLPSAGSATVDVAVTTIAGATLTSLATVSSDSNDPNPSNNSVSIDTLVTAAGRSLEVSNTSDSGAGSLRKAILDSNADSGDRDTIVFNIQGSGVQTINLLSALPQITQPIVIDATTQTGYAGTPLIELNGNGLTAIGLNVQGGNSIVRGLAINRFNGPAITIQTQGGSVVEGNYIGIDPTGTVARPNTGHGVLVQSANNRIGGVTAAARNVISGNQGTGVVLQNSTATNNLVQGNYIGTNGSGTSAIANLGNGIDVQDAPNATITNNVVSGNNENGIALLGSGTDSALVRLNTIGANVLRSNPVANRLDGIRIDGARLPMIGGPASVGNFIAGNGQHGVGIYGPSFTFELSGNVIGYQAPLIALGNTGDGVFVGGGTNANIGSSGIGNSIKNNGRNGVTVATGVAAAIEHNSMAGNAGLGIDLGGDGVTPNDAGESSDPRQNYPVLTGVVGGVTGTLNSAPNSSYSSTSSVTRPAIPQDTVKARVSFLSSHRSPRMRSARPRFRWYRHQPDELSPRPLDVSRALPPRNSPLVSRCRARRRRRTWR